ncbi:hypothetical protein pb186bvf_001827 [Paramecium bursaria]
MELNGQNEINIIHEKKNIKAEYSQQKKKKNLIRKMIDFRRVLKRYLQFQVGVSQIILMKDSLIIWSIIQILGDVQMTTFIFTSEILNGQDDSFYFLCYFANPLLQALRYDLNYVVLICANILLFALHLTTAIILLSQTKAYHYQKITQKTIQYDTISRKYERLSQIYGYSDYSNFWFQIVHNKKSLSLSLLRIISILNNSLNQYFNRQLVYFIFYIFINEEAGQIFLASILLIQVGINYALFLRIYKQSISVSGCMFYTLKVSNLIYLYEIYSYTIILYSVMTDDKLTVDILLIFHFAIQISKYFFEIKYVESYKKFIFLGSSTFNGTFAIFYLIGIQYWIVIAPLIIKFLIISSNIMIQTLMNQYLFPEKDQKGVFMREQQNLIMGAYIRDLIDKMKFKQVQSLQNAKFTYYPQFLKLYDQLNLQKAVIYVIQNDFEGQNQQLKIENSRIIMHVGHLFNKHSEKCQNIYCFCKGFRGESNKLAQQELNIRNLQVNSDLSFNQIYFYSDMMNRFMRNYTKAIFMMLKDQRDLDIIYLIQLITYVANSDECIQSVLIALELVSRLTSLNQSITWFEEISINVTIEYIKFNILLRYNRMVQVQEMDTLYNYDQFRSTQKKSIKIFHQFLDNIIAKQAFFRKLDRPQTFKTMETNLDILYKQNMKTQKMIESYQERTYSKTGLIFQLFFEFEIRNNFYDIEKLQSKLRTIDAKFFEFPDVHYDMEENAVEVCFVKADLNCSKQNDQYNGITSRGWIRDYSRNSPKYFEYSPEDFAKLKNVRELVPPSTSLIHDDFIELFLLTTRPNVLRVNIPLFIKTQAGMLVYTDYFADFNFKLPNGEFTIYIFLRKIKNKGFNNSNTNSVGIKNYFWIDQFGTLEAVTSNLIKNFKLTESSAHWLYQQQFNKIMPKFHEIQENLDGQLEAFLEEEQSCKGQISNEYSRTFKSVQIIFSAEFRQLLVQFPAEVCLDGKVNHFLIEGKVYLKYAQLIGRIYKVYLVEIDSYINKFELEQTVMGSSFKLVMKRASKPSKANSALKIDNIIPEEFEDSDKLGFSNHEFSSINQSSINGQEIFEESIEEVESERSDKNIEVKYHKITNATVINNDKSDSQYIEPVSVTVSAERGLVKDQKILSNQSNIQFMMQDNQSQQDSLGESKGLTKVLFKSQFYNKFAKSTYRPSVLNFTLAVNIFKLLTKIIFLILTSYYVQKSETYFETQIKNYAINDLSDLCINMVLFTQNIYNISLISSGIQKVDLVLEGQGSSLSDSNISYYDNKTKVEQQMWNFMFKVKFSYSNINTIQHQQQSYDFFLNSYPQFQIWMTNLNLQIIQNYSHQQDFLSSFISTILLLIGLLYIFTLGSFGYLLRLFILLIQKIVRCTTQIQMQSLNIDIIYYDLLAQKFIKKKDKNTMIFQLYEYIFDYKDKLNSLINNDRFSQKNSANTSLKVSFIINNAQQNSRKNILLEEKNNFRIFMIIPLSLLSATSFLLLFFILQFNLLRFQTDMNSKVNQYYTLIDLNNNFAQTVQSNIILSNQYINAYDQNLRTNYIQYNLNSNKLLNDDSYINQQFQITINKQICIQQTCSTSEYITLQDAIQYLFKDILQNEFKGFQFNEEQRYIILFTFSSFKQLIQQCQDEIISLFNQQYKSTQGFLLGFGSLILLFQLFQAGYIYKWLQDKFYNVKQFVYLLPVSTLYIEDSFYKTLYYISNKENQLIQE